MVRPMTPWQTPTTQLPLIFVLVQRSMFYDDHGGHQHNGFYDHVSIFYPVLCDLRRWITKWSNGYIATIWPLEHIWYWLLLTQYFLSSKLNWSIRYIVTNWPLASNPFIKHILPLSLQFLSTWIIHFSTHSTSSYSIISIQPNWSIRYIVTIQPLDLNHLHCQQFTPSFQYYPIKPNWSICYTVTNWPLACNYLHHSHFTTFHPFHFNHTHPTQLVNLLHCNNLTTWPKPLALPTFHPFFQTFPSNSTGRFVTL